MAVDETGDPTASRNTGTGPTWAKGVDREGGAVPRIVTDAAVLEPSYVPEPLPHRDEQRAALARALEPVGRGDRPGPVVLAGPTGTGKTCVARHALRQLDPRQDIRGQYVDCWHADGRFDVFSRLLDGADLPTYDLHRGSTPHATLMDRLRAGLPDRYVVVLDEVDRLDDGLLYALTRLAAVTLVVVTSRPAALLGSLDPRLRSRLRAGVRVSFERYPAPALVDILHGRVDRGLASSAVGDGHLRRIAAAADGDAGHAIRTLRIAARLADRDGAAVIDRGTLTTAIGRARAGAPRRAVADLPAHHRHLYDLVCEAGDVAPATLYERYCRRVAEPKSRRTVRAYLAELVEDGLLGVEGETRQRRYRPASRTRDPARRA